LSKDPKNPQLQKDVKTSFSEFESIISELTEHKESEIKKRKEKKTMTAEKVPEKIVEKIPEKSFPVLPQLPAIPSMIFFF
jgi:hypothetical protein